MQTPDDLPWPELGNVSRGATRGNQGQKGALGPPDQEGRCVLQLRVQPGVLCVKLNRRSSEWYRTLDGEVNRALKLTKTYWRKARRRQDYDPRADQDHMELHEWLQQLKDKTMSHLEILMQKGDIPGPPYVMPDDVDLGFLRKFIERHNTGIPHNPRLRHLGPNASQPAHIEESMEVSTPELSDQGYSASTFVDQMARMQSESGPSVSSNYIHSPNTSSRQPMVRTSTSPSTATYDQLVHEAQSSGQFLQDARAAFSRAQTQTHEAFQRYTACLEAEDRARRDVAVAEQHRDELISAILSRTQSSIDYARHSSLNHDEVGTSQHNHTEYAPHHMADRRTSGEVMPQHNSPRSMEWRQPEVPNTYPGGLEAIPQPEIRTPSNQCFKPERKHSRSWEQAGHVDITQSMQTRLPPRKRPHHMVDPSSHSGPVISQSAMSLPL
ncbi:hypothetical protein SCLCIDRAFT_587902 [Scleroderma citrinum Foug A]|uniref:Uncharacterized protein n=1 Tax=Scleroderma citrinum Foug A TaxID=1036808 RepID=A0A0C2ZGQ1_9AGAM|nr:hypothetical protein SCLCIDRAFT_587902 [Scleroderma citrinum Foug A]